ncbi:MAG TPA: glycosyltransferase [Thermomicrobiales bacterium]|nr:glycosyltransferase [Thermomicrobiales bacterium]
MTSNRLDLALEASDTTAPQTSTPGAASPLVTRHLSLVTPRVAFFTPLSPVESGISFYSEELLPVLARALDLDVYVDGYTPANAAALGAVRVRDAREYERARRRRPYDAVIYQLGNSPAHAYMYDRGLREPGIVVLHDVVLHHLHLWMAVNRGRRKEYIATLEQLYGARGREIARLVQRGQTPPALFDFPLVEPVLEAARVVLVHNATSAERVRALRPGTDVRVVPMGVPLPGLPPREEARARLGVPPEAFLVVSHGHITPYKRLDVALRAFRRLLVARPDAHFLIAGSGAPNSLAALDRQIGYLGLGRRVRRLGFVPAATVADLLAAADCCVNLRYPSAGETSASLLRIMGGGLPVLVSDAGSFRELPDDCCVKVPVGRLEEELLAEYLVELADNAPLRAALGCRARRFVAERHSLERAAAGYLDALGVVVGREMLLPEGAIRPPVPPIPGGTSPGVGVPSEEATAEGTPASCSPQDWGAGGAVAVRNHVAPDGVVGGAGEPTDPDLLVAVADALDELGLAGHGPTERGVAAELVALGCGAPADGAGMRGKERGWRRVVSRARRR